MKTSGVNSLWTSRGGAAVTFLLYSENEKNSVKESRVFVIGLCAMDNWNIDTGVGEVDTCRIDLCADCVISTP